MTRVPPLIPEPVKGQRITTPEGAGVIVRVTPKFIMVRLDGWETLPHAGLTTVQRNRDGSVS